MPSGARARAAGAAVVELDSPEASLELDLGAAIRAGRHAVRIDRPCRVSAETPLASLALVRLLREANADGVPVSWRGGIDDGIDPHLLFHLPPPDRMADGADPALSEWRQAYRPGLCYYRLGPDFVFIKDMRRAGAAARFRLDGVTDSFRALEAIVRVTDLDAATRRALEDLDGEGLVLRLGDLATLLPSRMRRWPVPALEV